MSSGYASRILGGKALRTMPQTTWAAAVVATRFLAVTGWRRGEALALKWSEIDLATRTARLADTKTGSSLRPLSHAACEVLRALPRLGELVFPASIGADKLMRGFHKAWLRIAKRAALGPDFTPHVLRHSYAWIAADQRLQRTHDCVVARTQEGERHEQIRASRGHSALASRRRRLGSHRGVRTPARLTASVGAV
jgi:integrase